MKFTDFIYDSNFANHDSARFLGNEALLLFINHQSALYVLGTVGTVI